MRPSQLYPPRLLSVLEEVLNFKQQDVNTEQNQIKGRSG